MARPPDHPVGKTRFETSGALSVRSREGRAIFVGTIPQDLRTIVREHTAGWSTDELYVGCSGNMTIERTVHGRFRLHSNDVSVYTSAIASWLAGQPFRLDVAQEWREEYGWLTGYLDEPIRQAATIMLLTGALQGLGKRNLYYERMRSGYRDQWERLHAATVAKLGKIELRLDDFHCGDVRAYMDDVPADGAVCSCPPFDVAGYETLFAPLERVLDWDRPEYPIMDLDALHGLLEQMRSKRHWLYGLNHQLEGHERWLRGIVQPTARNRPIYVYAGGGPSRTALAHQRTVPVTVPRLAPGVRAGERLSLAKLTAEQFTSLRSQYLDPGIAPAQAMLSLGVLLDGLLAGCCAFNPGQWGSDMYLLSDFAVSPTDYPRLSKLVLMAALSTEALVLLERMRSRRVREITTTAFSDHPVSMKYRSIFSLVKREEQKAGPHRYQLNYVAPAGRWSLQEALATWKKRYGRSS